MALGDCSCSFTQTAPLPGGMVSAGRRGKQKPDPVCRPESGDCWPRPFGLSLGINAMPQEEKKDCLVVSGVDCIVRVVSKVQIGNEIRIYT